MKAEAWIWIGASVFIGVTGALSIRYGIDHKELLIPIVVAVAIEYILSIYVYYRLFHLGNLGAVYSIATGLALVLVTLAGLFLFHDRLTTREIVGLVLIVIGVILT